MRPRNPGGLARSVPIGAGTGRFDVALIGRRAAFGGRSQAGILTATMYERGMTPMYSVRHATRGELLATHVRVADRAWSRLKGLIGKSSLDVGEGLLFTACQAVHMYGMRFPLDVVFMDESGTVVATYEDLEPGHRTTVHRDAYYALEVPSGTVGRTRTLVGDRVHLEELPKEPLQEGVQHPSPM